MLLSGQGQRRPSRGATTQGMTVWRTQVEQEQAGRPLCSTVVRQPAHDGVWGEVVIAGHRGQMLSIQVLRDWQP